MRENKKIRLGIFTVIIILLVGCSQKSIIEKESESTSHFKGAVFEGKDFYISDFAPIGERYRIFHQASTGFSGTSGIRRSATNRANKFCSEKGDKMIMQKISEHTASPPYIFGNFPRIEIIFVCVDSKS